MKALRITDCGIRSSAARPSEAGLHSGGGPQPRCIAAEGVANHSVSRFRAPHPGLLCHIRPRLARMVGLLP
jgi:hypothetical protein